MRFPVRNISSQCHCTGDLDELVPGQAIGMGRGMRNFPATKPQEHMDSWRGDARMRVVLS